MFQIIQAPRKFHLLTLMLLMAGLAGSAFAPAVLIAQESAPAAVNQEDSVERWKQRVWNAALAGDQEAIEKYFDEVPETAQKEHGASIRDAIEAYRTHITEAASDRSEDRLEAREKMAVFREEGKVVEALSKAVELQTLSDICIICP